MDINTHKNIDQRLCGKPVQLEENVCTVQMAAVEEMAADDKGLVHGGFVFGLADYAAMLAVNDPYVVLGSSTATFLKPVKVGETLLAEARVTSTQGKKHMVAVTVTRDSIPVFKGELTCFVLDKHVLD